MNRDTSKATQHLDGVYQDICKLGLQRNVTELEAYGLTVVEPRKVAPPEFIERLRQRVLEIAEAKSGGQLLHYKGVGHLLYYLLFRDRIFEEGLLNPVALSLITYLLGESCVLSSLTAMIKGPTEEHSVLHTDNGMIPSPFPPYAQVANASWLLTDYSRKAGCLLYVPGSHRLCRHPTASEREDEELMVPVEAPAGSLVVWHGNLWHGAFPKTTPGLRVTLIMLFSRMYLRTQEPYRESVTAEILARNPERFAKLMGQHIAYGWTDDGPDFSTSDRRKYLDLERGPGERLYD